MKYIHFSKSTAFRFILIFAVISTIVLAISFSVYRIIRTTRVIEDYYKQGRWESLSTKYAKTKQQNNMVIFFGDSMTELLGFYLSENDSLVNMGISGDFTIGLLKRTEAVIRLQPSKIFIMIGINDIIEQVSQDQIQKNYEQLIDTLQKRCPESTLYVQSTLPTVGLKGMFNTSRSINKKVQSLNTFLQSLCMRKNIIYLDISSLLADVQGDLKKEFTTDGIHLNAHGYAIWISELNRHGVQSP